MEPHVVQPFPKLAGTVLERTQKKKFSVQFYQQSLQTDPFGSSCVTRPTISPLQRNTIVLIHWHGWWKHMLHVANSRGKYLQHCTDAQCTCRSMPVISCRFHLNWETSNSDKWSCVQYILRHYVLFLHRFWKLLYHSSLWASASHNEFIEPRSTC